MSAQNRKEQSGSPRAQLDSTSPPRGSGDPDYAEAHGGPLGIRHLRLRLSQDQVNILEASFRIRPYLDAADRERLSRQVGLQPKQVAVWFQNRRARLRLKQGSLGPATSLGTPARRSSLGPDATQPALPHAPEPYSPNSGRYTLGTPGPFSTFFRSVSAAPDLEQRHGGASAPASACIAHAPSETLLPEAPAGQLALPAWHEDGSLEVALMRVLGGEQTSRVCDELGMMRSPIPDGPASSTALNMVPAAPQSSAAPEAVPILTYSRPPSVGSQVTPQGFTADPQSADGNGIDPDALCKLLLDLLAAKASPSATADAKPVPHWHHSAKAFSASGSRDQRGEVPELCNALAVSIAELQAQLDIMAEDLMSPAPRCTNDTDAPAVHALIEAARRLLSSIPIAGPRSQLSAELPHGHGFVADNEASPTKRFRAMPAGTSERVQVPVPTSKARTSALSGAASASYVSLKVELPSAESSWKQEQGNVTSSQVFGDRSWVEPGSLMSPKVDEAWPGVPQQTLITESRGSGYSFEARGRSPYGLTNGVPHRMERVEKRGRAATWSPSSSGSSRAEPEEALPQSPSIVHTPSSNRIPLHTLGCTEFHIPFDSLTLVSSGPTETVFRVPSPLVLPESGPITGAEPNKSAMEGASPFIVDHPFLAEPAASWPLLPGGGQGSGAALDLTGHSIGADLVSGSSFEDPAAGSLLPTLASLRSAAGRSSDSAGSFVQSVMSVRDVEEILSAEEVPPMDPNCAKQTLEPMHTSMAPKGDSLDRDAIGTDEMDVPSMLMSFLDRL